MTQEIWKPVVGYEGLYEVSNQGHVRSFHSSSRNGFGKFPLILSGGNVRGYRQLVLCKNCEKRSGPIHRLVAEAFIGAPPTLAHEVNHKNFDKADNRPENLEWITHAENNRYSAAVIPRLRGEANRSKLTEEQVREIRRRRDLDGETLKSLARRFGASNPTIHAIVRREKWKHVA